MSASYDPTTPTARDRLRHDLYDHDVSLVGDGSLDTPAMAVVGAGYLAPPVVSFVGGTPTRSAVGRAIMSGDTVIGVVMDDRGAGYAVLPTVVFTGGSPTIPASAVVAFATNALDPDETYDAYINLYGEDEARWRMASAFLARYAGQVDAVHLDDGTEVFWRQRVNAWKEIIATWVQYFSSFIRGTQKPLVGSITGVAVIGPSDGAPFDANDQIYRGTPYGRRFW